MKEALANEQVFLQMMFKKNEKMLQLISEEEMLRDLIEAKDAQLQELRDKIPSVE